MSQYSKNQQYVSKFIANGDGFLFCMRSCLIEHQTALIKAKSSGKLNIEMLYVVPAIANGAFACELYFKAIRWMESGKKERGHELVKLYKELSDASKESILEISGFNESEMQATLEQCNKAFEKARYFELETVQPNSLQKLALAAKRQTSVLINEKLEAGSFAKA